MAFWNWFQKAYDEIDSWDYPEEWKPAIQYLNDQIPEVVRKAILTYIKQEYDKSTYKAKDSVSKVAEMIREVANKM